jgi:hypothetical protein
VIEPERAPRFAPGDGTCACFADAYVEDPAADGRRSRGWSRRSRRPIARRVATDELPLLVDACSEACVERLPAPPEGYVDRPHRGGDHVEQPPPR